VARFDINNNKDITGFEIERVVIYETREAPFLFENAEGRDTIKRTTVEINHFSAMDGANKGLSASAFYLYPALNNEEVRIVLEGKRSDEAEVRAYSLKINNSRELNIQAGQRYLLNIVSAGSGEVTGELTVRNWEDKAIGIKESSAEDYSGITWITKDQYAVVTDKKDGFYLFTIDMDNDGNVTRFTRGAFMGDPSTSRDCEGIIWHPDRGTFFISGEADQEILEYNSNGSKTGEKLAVPSMFKGGTGNYGFEALAYNQTTGLFWTTTESTLSRDGAQASYNNSIHNLLRIQSFDESLQAQEQYAYKMDLPQATATARTYAFGVPEITALPNGDLLILEREFYVTEFGLGSWVQVKLYLVEPGKYSDVSAVEDLRTLADISFMEKQLLWEKRTTFPADLANYEGMCLGPLLNNGERPLLLINDSQAGYQGLLKEYLLVLKLTEEQNSDIIAWE
ncbi:esterase-like activity of phytase family protein, partial [Odoribacter sp. OttesenSCG-928-J03]|nr:esterase-like activity of phytase family protein [Odoribacter sp. OttesenSCG-928-J03]